MLSWSLSVTGAALIGLAFATRIPVLAVIGAVDLVAGLALRYSARAPRRSWPRALLGGTAVVIGLVVAIGIGYVWLRARAPVPDAFYDAPEDGPAEPGTLIRGEPFTRAVPDGARAWRLLYRTTSGPGRPAVASAIVLAPGGAPSEPRPVVAWTHGTTGVASHCAPTVLPAPFPFDATVPAVDRLLAEGWVLVGTDYAGLGTGGGHGYLIGEPEARSALDAVRAARQLPDLTLDRRTVVWGHSQGGHAALWTGILAPDYASDVGVIGVAALAPATEVGALVDAVQHAPVGKIMASFVMAAYSRTYPDVSFEDYVGPEARARAMAGRCLSGAGGLLSLLTSLTMERDFFERPPTEGALARRFDENVPTGRIEAPLLIAQGLDDDHVLPAVQERFVQARCDGGQALEYRTYAGRDHVSLVARDSALTPDLVQWTQDRFRGAAVKDGCVRLTR